jgi:YD repeat-containing protein
MRLSWQRICLTAVVSVFPLVVLAQSQPLESEYKKLIHVDTDISPLGATPFGENVSTYDGSLSFDQTDFSLKGNGPLISVGRSYHVTGVAELPLKDEGAAADWELEIPRIETYTANQLNVTGWQVPAANPQARCSSFGVPPTVNGIENGAPSPPELWWYGYHLIVPGAGSQTLQKPFSGNTVRPSGKTIVAMTKDNWVVSCGVAADNDSGEGFVVTSPDGTQYTFAHLVYRAMASSTRPESSGPQSLVAANTFSPDVSVLAAVTRRDALMMVTNVTDRFGQSVTYSYTGDDLTQISGSDGRLVTLTYVPSTHRVQTIKVMPSSGAARTWTYAYGTTGAGSDPTLTSVTLPDGSAWTMNLGAWMSAVIDTPTNICANPTSATGSPVYATMTHPSGLSATFGIESITRGRSYVPKTCLIGNASAPAEIPQNVYQLAVSSKVFAGAGIGSQTWSYAYSPANGSWSTDPCATGSTCPTTVWTDVTDPLGNDTRYTFSNVYDQTEGHPIRTDYYSGSASGTLMRSEVTGYATATNGPWASPYVAEMQNRTNRAVTGNLTPVNSTVVTQDGNTFTRSTSAFDVYGRPTVTIRSSNVAGQASITETTSYLNDTASWVLGLTQEVDNNSTGEVESHNTYNAGTDTLASRSVFGQALMSYGWNTAGQLASFTDPLNHTTTLGNYKRGIPQSIGFPDSTSESLVVDDFGQISSITNQAGNTTSYLYDSIGRIAEIDYPTGDSVAWAKQTFSYSFETWVSHGIAANHWLRGVTQGPKVAYTYFDALMRPIETLTRRSSDGGTPKTSRTDYDFHGNKTFQSYLTEGDQALSALTNGITTNYDALSRVTSTVQPSELGNLTSTTNYLSGARKQVIDPKGNSTTTSYQVFDEPSYDNVIQVSAPEGVTQSITRDLYGNPLAISQGGITKSMVYDSFHRLCRTTEPESGSEVMAYDAANNLSWSASGQAITGTDCGQTQVVTAAQTVRGYDAMNRVTSITYPAGTAATAMSYTLTGKPLTATSGAVTWTYGYNKLDLLTAEGLSVDGYSWALGYGYDVNGVLASTVYPDGKAVTYSPDFLGRPTTAGSYAAGATYYPDGALQGFTFGSGAAYTASENSRNLLASFSYGTASAVSVSEDLAYDGNANITQVCDIATSTKPCNDPTNDGLRTKTLGYDGLNRLTSANAANLWGTESYTYDTLNNIRTLTTAGATNTYNYDASNRLASVTKGASTVSSFGYDARGNVTLRNSVPMVFDEANRLTQITGLDAYTYDAEGRRVKKAPASGSPTYYAYNQAGQLMWQYDPATTNGTDYIYLGKKMVASALIDMSAFQPSQINVTLTLIGVPTLSADGTTISVTVDIANQGTVTLSSSGRDPVHMGTRIFTTAGTDTGVSVARTNFPIIAPGTHATVTSTIPASAVVGTGNVIRLVPVQEGVAWFDDWGTTPIEVGPFSACAPVSTFLCNTQYALRGAESNLSLTLTSGPTLMADGQNLVSTVDVQNNGTINISGTGTYPVNLGNHFANAAGVTIVTDVNRAGLPVIPPGGHVPVTITTPVSGGVGSGNRIQFELVQEGLHWFRDYGHPPISTNSFGDLAVPASSTTGAYTVSWTAVPGASSYRLDEQASGGAWTTVQTANSLAWSTSGRTPGAYSYRMAPCASSCGPPGVSGTVAVSLPPPAPTAISVPATSTGNIAIGWSTAMYATSYTLEQSFNGGAFAAIYSGASNSYAYTATSTGAYTYRVKACDAAGCSGYGPSGSSTITIPPASAPSLSVPATNNSGAYTVSWSAVPGATNYQAEQQVNGGAFSVIQGSGATSWSTSGQGNGTYGYRVIACNGGGCGPYSATANVVVALVPAVPTGLHTTLVNVSKGLVTLAWNAVSGATDYQIKFTSTGTSGTHDAGIATSLSGTYRPVQGNISFNVEACNAAGCSAWSAPISTALNSD